MTASQLQALPASFRDPNAQLYVLNNEPYRLINESGVTDYQKLMESGLYDRLISLGYLIPHKEVTLSLSTDLNAKIVLKPEKLVHISYPYEWCFSQLKDAALLTLEIVKIALEFGMILKDATAYNIQFHKGKPILIDTCSFTEYRQGSPWQAYHQFCKHFLAPVALMAKKDIRLGMLSKQFIDGIPLDYASKLLPFNSWLSFSLLANIHLHAGTQKKYSDHSENVSKKANISKIGLLGLIDSLESGIKKLTWRPIKTEWGNYYNQTNYSDKASTHKAEIVQQLINHTSPRTVWDLGGNNGHYSRIAAAESTHVVSWDIDPVAVESNYRKTKAENNHPILPLIQDLTNPSSGIGWAHNERESLQTRGHVDLIMALALIHHLSISNNVPLKRIADFFSKLAKYLIIEFVPKEDSQVTRLLTNRQDIFSHYNKNEFKKEFSHDYTVIQEIPVTESCRTIFLMKRK